MKTRKELHEGIDGSGHKLFMVVTLNAAGRWVWIERFTNEAEARNWIRWA